MNFQTTLGVTESSHAQLLVIKKKMQFECIAVSMIIDFGIKDKR